MKPQNLISSRSNPLVKEIRALERRQERDRQGAFFVEGIQPVMAALEAGAPVVRLVVAPELLKSAAAREAVRRAENGGTPVVRVSGEVFGSMAEREHPTGLGAVVKKAARGLNELVVTEKAVFVVLYEVNNPGNLGTILRTVDAVGGNGVILVGDATDPYHPTAVKASRGALFSVPLVQLKEAEALLRWCEEKKVRPVMTSDQGAADLWSGNLKLPLALIFGNEGEGLPADLMARGERVRIPMAGAVDSLNLAVAAGVILYEVKRRETT